jgi:hypothetical protein
MLRDQATTEVHPDLIQIRDDVDHPPDRHRVDRVVVAEDPDVVVPGQPDP